MHLPQGMAYGNWDFPCPTIEDLAFEIELRGNTDPMPGRYYQLYDGHIGGVGSYFGLQTNLFRPGHGWQGQGMIFSRWRTRSPADARVAANGWIESAGHEGDFVGVRAKVPFSAGKFRCQLKVSDQDPAGVWYELTINDLQTGRSFSAGCLRFPEAKINSGGGTWTEVYFGARHEADIPETELQVVSITANNATLRPTQCRVCYQQNFAHSNAFVDDGVLVLRSGGKVSRVHLANRYQLKR